MSELNEAALAYVKEINPGYDSWDEVEQLCCKMGVVAGIKVALDRFIPEKVVHKFNPVTGKPTCPAPGGPDVESASHVDAVTCVDCLRRLAKSAVQYGNGRRANS